MKCTLVKLTLLIAFDGEVPEGRLEALGDDLAESVRQDRALGALTVAAEYDSVEKEVPEDDDELAAALDQEFPTHPPLVHAGFDRLISKLSLEGVNGIAPLLPEPAYGQDVAMVAFLIDQLRAKVGPEPDGALNEWAEDRCKVCDKLIGRGWRLLHVGLCETCRDAPKS
jgi:hypothetical protein